MIARNDNDTLLIVDYEYLITEILECTFEDEGYTAFKTVSAVKALQMLRCARPDLITTDLMMPTMNGAEFAAAIHRVFL